ncbi:MAG: hypothetical protein KAV82_06800 [Phycisphaerae bacterium]|nr:hypothetical protein [Phycisphaerae bacterium]
MGTTGQKPTDKARDKALVVVPDVLARALSVPPLGLSGAPGAFNGWLDNFVTYAGANLANLDLVAGDLAPVTTAQTAWATSLSAHVTAHGDT